MCKTDIKSSNLKCQSINQSIILFSNAGLQSGSHKAAVDLQQTNEM